MRGELLQSRGLLTECNKSILVLRLYEALKRMNPSLAQISLNVELNKLNEGNADSLERRTTSGSARIRVDTTRARVREIRTFNY